jgi:anthranilate synthase component 2
MTLANYQAKFLKLIIDAGVLRIGGEYKLKSGRISPYFFNAGLFNTGIALQAIGEAFNSPLKNVSPVWHGVASNINVISKDKIFNNCPQKFLAGRYHSWLINELTIHPNLIVTAVDDQNNIMAIKHKFYNVRGVQFHPESILSEYGETIIKNWLSDTD